MDQTVIPPIVGILLALLLVSAFAAGEPGATRETEGMPIGLVTLGGAAATIVMAFLLIG